MKQKVTVFPSEFQIEPIAMDGFDVWQDWEGLQDASPKCKLAWKEYQGEWRAQRKSAVATSSPDMSSLDKLTDTDLKLIRGAKRVGAAFGVVSTKGDLPVLSPAEKATYWRWRSRVLRSDPSAWAVFWAPDKVMAVAARFGKTEREVLAIRSIVARWFGEELSASEVNCGGPGVIV